MVAGSLLFPHRKLIKYLIFNANWYRDIEKDDTSHCIWNKIFIIFGGLSMGIKDSFGKICSYVDLFFEDGYRGWTMTYV